MRADVSLDDIDRKILRLLVEDGRRSVADVAARVRLSPAPVTRRIDRLERLGVITGYTAVVDESRVGGFDAFTELRFSGDTPVAEFIEAVRGQPEVLEVLTIAGDPDALVRIRVESVQHLQAVVDGLRRSGRVVGTKTLIVLSSWRREPLTTGSGAARRHAAVDREADPVDEPGPR